jgi:hypothetical protein
MKTFAKLEIKNKHGQQIYMFAKHPGNTELEKCINFLNKMKVSFEKWTTKDINGNDTTCVVCKKRVEVFNTNEEKIGEFEAGYNPSNIGELSEDLYNYLNIEI